MSQTYTLKQAMNKLELTSRAAFHHVMTKHPHAFVIVHRRNSRDDVTLYDKQVLNKFAQIRKYFIENGHL